MIGEIVSHYRVLSELGAGGMDVVYKARDLSLDRDVALKFLPPELVRDADAKKRFVHEAKAAAADAKREYSTFLEMWSEAEEDMPQLIDARQRNEHLLAGQI